MNTTPSNYRPDSDFPSPHYGPAEDEIDLKELILAIWAGKWWVIAITSVFAVLSVVVALSMTNRYEASVTLAPTEASNGAGNLGQLGGLASLAGLSLGQQPVDKSVMALEVLESRKFLMNFIDKHQLTDEIMAVKGWDLVTNTLHYNRELYNPETGEWLREATPPRQPKPSLLETAKVFHEMLTIEPEGNTGLTVVTLEYFSPVLAKQWVDWLVSDLNQTMRERQQQEAQRSINYLNEQLTKTRVSEFRSVLYDLIEEQTKTLMFTEVRDEYVFQTVDPAVVAEKRSSPRRALICILGTFVGGVLAVMFVVIRYFWKKG
ncbi:LPS O-antigen length regulator [Idiomarina tyrosinivorans]|uniref:LPS O-antigen length regulator n=1 Tax=Idiomarina tyrosinivorans TaxID=1445662 RepID=A0A432ZQR4_9GAMM|nr:Wzz/FepE/Etk N-terminal domain-containing protein [Idiomarina tyrosinivorans]RUO80275.1 LPS O-antigen length regulator [Idiomarina tyrosinivorans]